MASAYDLSEWKQQIKILWMLLFGEQESHILVNENRTLQKESESRSAFISVTTVPPCLHYN